MGILKRTDKMEDINPLRDLFKQYESNQYIRLGSDISVTEMIDHPRPVLLRNRHPNLKKPNTISGILPAILGTSTHDMFERYLRNFNTANPGSYLLERRMLTNIKCDDGTTLRLAGRFDMLEDNHILWDIKQTSTFKFIKGNVDDFERQLNVYAYMLGLDGFNIDKVKILAVFPDWNKYERQRRMGTYPPNKITEYEFEVWPKKDQEDYVVSRVNIHNEARKLPDKGLPLCTEKDMWAQPTVWAVYKNNKVKKASRLLDSHAEAKSYLTRLKGADSTSYIKERTGTRTRCMDWCAAAPICDVHQAYLKTL